VNSQSPSCKDFEESVQDLLRLAVPSAIFIVDPQQVPTLQEKATELDLYSVGCIRSGPGKVPEARVFVGSDQDTVDRIMREDSQHEACSNTFDCRSALVGAISGAFGTFAALAM
jgi:hypothetical protein